MTDQKIVPLQKQFSEQVALRNRILSTEAIKLQLLQNELNLYLEKVKVDIGLVAPEKWVYDLNQQAFVQAPEKEKPVPAEVSKELTKLKKGKK